MSFAGALQKRQASGKEKDKQSEKEGRGLVATKHASREQQEEVSLEKVCFQTIWLSRTPARKLEFRVGMALATGGQQDTRWWTPSNRPDTFNFPSWEVERNQLTT
eukprot:TRINITY_DN15635_c0_g2_i1.p1 TRINITY_DN15635_c0_g2~~TRINITY_DN15635_c0_g2_i1.p1  ORF type:complete len:105 (-),score=9.18 TRINITY_DN15635_c0_g2_i1:249-563(-)